MSKKSFGVIAVLSVVTTYGVAFLDLLLSKSKGILGLPFGFSRFNFLGNETDNRALILDIVFWFVIIWIIWKVFEKIKR